jgi:tRNA 2-(methylsulfanyl)-N6-isopentenyladenosine37 hydroxylase
LNSLHSPLLVKTPDPWADVVLQDFDAFLPDHAACERKASALCMSLVVKYADRRALVEPLICLAKEEMEHFHQVYRLLTKRGLTLGDDEKDPYVNGILKNLRHGRDERLLDRLIMSAVVEARGAERFGIIGEKIADPELKVFYQSLSRSEASHYKVFMKIARNYFSIEQIEEATCRIAGIEKEAMIGAPLRARLH